MSKKKWPSTSISIKWSEWRKIKVKFGERVAKDIKEYENYSDETGNLTKREIEAETLIFFHSI